MIYENGIKHMGLKPFTIPVYLASHIVCSHTYFGIASME